MRNMKRFTVVLLVALLLFPAASGLAEEGDFPALNDAGFLDSGEFVFEDAEKGVWRYASPELWIEIYRRSQEKPAETWYEAEVRCAEGSQMPHMIASDPENWVKKSTYPYKLARNAGTVLAVSSDYAYLRIQQKARAGVVIRAGEVLSDRTWPKNSSHFPNLDCLALYPDGTWKVYDSDEMTAQDYLKAGATDVLAFGPWLIRNGELNEKALKKYGRSRAQRVAVGMVEKGHYFFMMLEGRITRSRGAGISFLANLLLEKGCVEAMNLDGGQTASIVFMGHQLCKMDNKKRNVSSRRTADLLGVGKSALLPLEKDPW